MKSCYVLIVSFFLLNNCVVAQHSISLFVIKYSSLAKIEEQRTGVPATITLAQGILESGAGLSELAVNANNFFGIKCGNVWFDSIYYHNDDTLQECFRMYKNDTLSFIDHSDFLKNKKRYSSLFLFSKWDYINWAKGLQIAGYATNPYYAVLLISLIEKFKLYEINEGKLLTFDTLIIKNNGVNVEFLNDSITSTNFKIINNKGTQTAALVYFETIDFNNTKAVFILRKITVEAVAFRLNIEINSLLDYNKNLVLHELIKEGTIVIIP